jgi:hypothetical protein
MVQSVRINRGIVTIVFALSLALPLSQIILGHKYLTSSDTKCTSSGNLNPITWLLVSGWSSLTIWTFLYLFFMKYKSQDETPPVICNIIIILSFLFQLGWIVTGGIMFWSHPMICDPTELYNILCISIIVHVFALMEFTLPFYMLIS